MNIRHRKSKSPDEEREYARFVAQETLIFETTEEICRILDSENITRHELARRLGKSKGFVTQVLSGERNMTLKTMADFAFALGHRFQVHAVPIGRSGSHTSAPVYFPLNLLASSRLSEVGRNSEFAAIAGVTRDRAQSYRKRPDARPGAVVGSLERWTQATQAVECEEGGKTASDHEFTLTA